MTNNFLKDFAYEYVLLHDNITRNQKLNLSDFINSASDEQVMALLLTGRCKYQLHEDEAKFVRSLFSETPIAFCESYFLGEIGAENPFTTAAIGHMGKAAADLAVRGGKDAQEGFKIMYQWIKTLPAKWKAYDIVTAEGPFGAPAKKIAGQADVAGLKKAEAALQGSWKQHYQTALNAIQNNKVLTGLVVAALVALIARKAYKSYFSKAAKACKGASDKKVCMKQHKAKAIQAQIKELQSGMKVCSAAKKPDKCRAVLNKKIMKAKKQLSR